MSSRHVLPNLRVCPLLVTFALGALSAIPARADTYSVDEQPQSGESISPEHYRMYIPHGVATVRAIILHQHGCGRGDWNTGWDVHWRALADKWDAALVSPWLEGDCGTWYNPTKGSGRALDDALRTMGMQSGHAELEGAPFVLWGHSGGGDWVTEMMKQRPTRVVAVVARSGGSDPGAPADGIPALMVRGGSTDIGTDVGPWFTRARKRGALVAIARDVDQWHECADLRVLAIPFLDGAMGLRLPPATKGAVTLRQPRVADGWLGDGSFAVASANGYAGDQSATSWLPNEAIAKKWSEFANPASSHGTGWSTDTSPPDSAPWDVSATLSGKDVTLSWRARADVESGIKSFKIYRDGASVGNLEGNASTTNVGGNFFQWGGFGDEASPGPDWPKPPELWPFPATSVDSNAPAGAHTYQVATVNGQGLEGPKSTPVPVFIGNQTDGSPPVLSITKPTSVSGGDTAQVDTLSTELSITGTASDDMKVVSIVWSNDRGGSGVANGTGAFTIDSLPLATGTNTVHVTVFDSANHATTATLVVSTTGEKTGSSGPDASTVDGGSPVGTQDGAPSSEREASSTSGGGDPGLPTQGTADGSTRAPTDSGAAVGDNGDVTGSCGCKSVSGSSVGLGWRLSMFAAFVLTVLARQRGTGRTRARLSPARLGLARFSPARCEFRRRHGVPARVRAEGR